MTLLSNGLQAEDQMDEEGLDIGGNNWIIR